MENWERNLEKMNEETRRICEERRKLSLQRNNRRSDKPSQSLHKSPKESRKSQTELQSKSRTSHMSQSRNVPSGSLTKVQKESRKDLCGTLGKLAEKVERENVVKEKRKNVEKEKRKKTEKEKREKVEREKSSNLEKGEPKLRQHRRRGRSRKVRRCINSKSKGWLQSPISSGILDSTRAEEDSSLKSPSESKDSHQELIHQPQPSMADRHTYGDKEHKNESSLDLGPAAGQITCFLTHNKPSRIELVNSELETKMRWSIERGFQIDEYLQDKINQTGKSIPIFRGLYLIRIDTCKPSIKWTVEVQPRFHVDANKLEKLIPFHEGIHSPGTGDSMVKPLSTSTISDIGKEVFPVADGSVGVNKIDGFRFNDVDQRKKCILVQSQDLAKSVNRFPIVQTVLIKEVKHQKYLAVTNEKGNWLLYFITVANGAIKEMTVIEGSEAGLRMGTHRIMTDALGVEGVELEFSCTKWCSVSVCHHIGKEVQGMNINSTKGVGHKLQEDKAILVAIEGLKASEENEKVKLEQGWKMARSFTGDGSVYLQGNQHWKFYMGDMLSCYLIRRTAAGIMYILTFRLKPFRPSFSNEIGKELKKGEAESYIEEFASSTVLVSGHRNHEELQKREEIIFYVKCGKVTELNEDSLSAAESSVILKDLVMKSLVHQPVKYWEGRGTRKRKRKQKIVADSYHPP